MERKEGESYAEFIERARAITPAQRLIDGLRLAEVKMRELEAAVRTKFPHFTDAEVQREMRRRIDAKKRWEDNQF